VRSLKEGKANAPWEQSKEGGVQIAAVVKSKWIMTIEGSGGGDGRGECLASTPSFWGWHADSAQRSIKEGKEKGSESQGLDGGWKKAETSQKKLRETEVDWSRDKERNIREGGVGEVIVPWRFVKNRSKGIRLDEVVEGELQGI